MKKFMLILILVCSYGLINAVQKTKVITKKGVAKNGNCNISAFKSKDGKKAYFVTVCDIK